MFFFTKYDVLSVLAPKSLLPVFTQLSEMKQLFIRHYKFIFDRVVIK